MCDIYCFQEFGKHDREPAKYIKQWSGFGPKTGSSFACEVGYERFLAPEVWKVNIYACYFNCGCLLHICTHAMKFQFILMQFAD